MSLSVRRAWIEIVASFIACSVGKVALRKESVDRNRLEILAPSRKYVALRKESVDRN